MRGRRSLLHVLFSFVLFGSTRHPMELLTFSIVPYSQPCSTQLLDTSTKEKMYRIDEHIACAVAGITSDANILIDKTREMAQRYLLVYQEPMPVEQLVQGVCDRKQGYTQFGGLRPYGVSFLFAGWDKHYGLQLYQSDPSGNYGGWKATAIGANHQAATSILKQEYQAECNLAEATALALKVLSKSMDSTSLNAGKLEMSQILLGPDNQVEYKLLTDAEVDKLLAESSQAAEQQADS